LIPRSIGTTFQHTFWPILGAVLSLNCGCRLVDWADSVDTLRVGLQDEHASRTSQRQNDKGLQYFEKGKVGKAETHFQKAIEHNPRSAAAHNNLGNMMMARRDYYQAAWEFQRASELDPSRIEPLINLGLIMEESERLEDAAQYYLLALDIEPNNPIAVGNFARLRVKQEYADPFEVHAMLKHLVFIDNRPEWVEWAEELLATRYRAERFGEEIRDSVPSFDSSNIVPTNSPNQPNWHDYPYDGQRVLREAVPASPDAGYPLPPPTVGRLP
jgi:Tfp pilus assembly protein PilF